MKPHAIHQTRVNCRVDNRPSQLKAAGLSVSTTGQIKLVPPSDETCSKLNAMARQYPFCIYYREKSFDPL